jgi:hypothetical protein
MEFGSRLPRDKLETSRVCLEEVAVMESGLRREYACTICPKFPAGVFGTPGFPVSGDGASHTEIFGRKYWRMAQQF